MLVDGVEVAFLDSALHRQLTQIQYTLLYSLYTIFTIEFVSSAGDALPLMSVSSLIHIT